ncbi:MAG: ribonucleotide-diphosphate reductase subunit beta [Candidatus Dojkabacteria bacterium]|nr:ribonucleotide-diphosphate reductase subunit beta [Candidatus Dojkabacteria bacterium]
MGIFDKRVNFKPFEYPEVVAFGEAIQHAYWLHHEWNFISDISEFHSYLTTKEKTAVKRAMLAISQIEVAVKKFWSKIGIVFPKPEIDQVGAIFAESEVRHSNAYSFLLEKLGLNKEFEQLLEIPEIKGRVEYLTKYLEYVDQEDKSKFSIALALFSLFVENVSLFSQFVIIKSFNKYKNLLKDIDNVIQATMVEEQVHANFGIWLLNKVKEEHPNIFNEDFYNKINTTCIKAYEAEKKIINWILEEGDLSFLTKTTLNEFLKHRFNESLIKIGGIKLFDVDYKELQKLNWFFEELIGKVHTDFFHKKSTNYSKKTKSVTADDLF